MGTIKLIAGIMANTPGIENVIVSTHCHNDLGLATANTLAGVMNGARQVEVTINGIGERAGNTSLEEVVMALHTRSNRFGQLTTNIDPTHITRVSRQVSSLTGMPVQPNKAIVGANAFAHEAGIHQDGMLKHADTYEIMKPESVGLNKSELVLGKHSGRHAFRSRLEELGYDLDGDELNKAFIQFKNLADQKKYVMDDDLVALADNSEVRPKSFYRLDGLQVTCGTVDMPTASIRLIDLNGNTHTAVEIGTGPVDATYKAIDSIVKMPNVLLEYDVTSVTNGIDEVGEVTVRLESRDDSFPTRIDPQSGNSRPRTFGGHGGETDIVVASAKAYLSALNKMLHVKQKYEKQ